MVVVFQEKNYITLFLCVSHVKCPLFKSMIFRHEEEHYRTYKIILWLFNFYQHTYKSIVKKWELFESKAEYVEKSGEKALYILGHNKVKYLKL